VPHTAHTIGYQFQTAIEGGFKEGRDKFSMKHCNQMPGHVFSYGERNSLSDVAWSMSRWLKAEGIKVKYVRDITADQWQKFLDYRTNSCSKSTLENYVSRIGKIQDLVEKKFHCQVEWKDQIHAPVSIKCQGIERIQSMSPEDFRKILAYGEHSTSKAAPAVKLAGKYGLRVSELAFMKAGWIDLEHMELHVIGKGRRARTLSIRSEDKEFLKSLKESAGSDKSRVFLIKPGSINKYFERALQSTELRAKYPQTNIHCVRKMVAQLKWDELRAEGYTYKETSERVSEYLGHGKDRSDVISVYVSNRH
jgi:integrase